MLYFYCAATSQEGGDNVANLLMSLVVGIVAGVIANMLYDRIRHRRY